jgi:hypothetical protein
VHTLERRFWGVEVGVNLPYSAFFFDYLFFQRRIDYKRTHLANNMTELTYSQKCAQHFDRCFTKKELIWKYIELAEKYEALMNEKDALATVLKFKQEQEMKQ